MKGIQNVIVKVTPMQGIINIPLVTRFFPSTVFKDTSFFTDEPNAVNLLHLMAQSPKEPPYPAAEPNGGWDAPRALVHAMFDTPQLGLGNVNKTDRVFRTHVYGYTDTNIDGELLDDTRIYINRVIKRARHTAKYLNGTVQYWHLVGDTTMRSVEDGSVGWKTSPVSACRRLQSQLIFSGVGMSDNPGVINMVGNDSRNVSITPTNSEALSEYIKLLTQRADLMSDDHPGDPVERFLDNVLSWNSVDDSLYKTLRCESDFADKGYLTWGEFKELFGIFGTGYVKRPTSTLPAVEVSNDGYLRQFADYLFAELSILMATSGIEQFDLAGSTNHTTVRNIKYSDHDREVGTEVTSYIALIFSRLMKAHELPEMDYEGTLRMHGVSRLSLSTHEGCKEVFEKPTFASGLVSSAYGPKTYLEDTTKVVNEIVQHAVDFRCGHHPLL